MSTADNIQKQIDDQQAALSAAEEATRSDDFNPDNAEGQKTLQTIKDASGQLALLGQQKAAAAQSDQYYGALESQTDEVFKANNWERGTQQQPTKEFEAYRKAVHELASKYPNGRPPTDAIGVLARDAAAAVKEQLAAATDDPPPDDKKGKKPSDKKAKADGGKKDEETPDDKKAKGDGDTDDPPPGEGGKFPSDIGKDGKPLGDTAGDNSPGMAVATYDPASLADPDASAGGGDHWGGDKGRATLDLGLTELMAAAQAESEAGRIPAASFDSPKLTVGGGG